MPVAPQDRPILALVVDRYPALDQPFVAQLAKGLEDRGFALEIWTQRRGSAGRAHPVHAEVKAPVRELPSSIGGDFLTVVASLLSSLGSGGFLSGIAMWLRSLMRDPSPGAVRHLGQAAAINATAPRGLRFILAVGAGNAAGVARLAARLRGIGWGWHADERALGTRGEATLSDLLADATLCLVSSEAMAERIGAVLRGRERVALLPPAVDLARFSAPAQPVSQRVGGSRDLAVRLVSIGPLEDGEGYREVLMALADLPKATHWRLVHIGDGSKASKLRQFALDLGLGPAVIWKGACDQSAVIAALRDADIYIHAPRPGQGQTHAAVSHCLLEAASQRLPIVSTRVAGASAFLVPDENAVLVKPGQVAALTEAVHRLAGDPAERARLGGAGRMRVELSHGLGPVLDDLARRLRAVGA